MLLILFHPGVLAFCVNNHLLIVRRAQNDVVGSTNEVSEVLLQVLLWAQYFPGFRKWTPSRLIYGLKEAKHMLYSPSTLDVLHHGRVIVDQVQRYLKHAVRGQSLKYVVREDIKNKRHQSYV